MASSVTRKRFTADDQDVKAPLYAGVGVPEYWLVDLNVNVVWRYSLPDQDTYRSVERFHRGQSIAPQLLPTCLIAVDDLLAE